MALSLKQQWELKKNIFICDIKYSLLLNEILSLLMILAGALLIPARKSKAAAVLMWAHRNSRRPNRQKKIEWLLQNGGLLRPEVLSSLLPSNFRMDDVPHTRVFKIKEKGENEKGVLVLKYNETFTLLRAFYDMERLLKDYYLVLELSYYGCCSPEILQYLEYKQTRIAVGASHPLEFGFLARLQCNVLPADFSSSTWVDDNLFVPEQAEKQYDCIMIAFYGDMKRHHVLFRALKRLNDPTYRACLVGVNLQYKQDYIERMAEYYGVRNNIEIFSRIPPEKVRALLNRSKVNVLLSYKEGGNKAIIEGLFANVPALVSREHVGINLEWINEQTGRLASPDELSRELLYFRDNFHRYTPRQWALKNISCKASTLKLEEVLKKAAIELGEQWTRPLAVKVNRPPDMDYYYSQEALQPFEFDYYRKKSPVRAVSG